MTSRAAQTVRRRRKAFSEMDLGRIGVVGLVLMVLVLAAALNIGKIRSLVENSTYTADFSEAGGLRGGDEVRVAGLKVGKVDSVELSGDHVEVTFGLSGVSLGDLTRASIKSDNALGSKFLSVEPYGPGAIRHIPMGWTDAGISVNDELGRLTSSTAQIDAQRLAKSFDSISTVLNQTPTEFRSALRGVSALSRTLSARDAELQTLLRHASGVSAVLADRNQEITSILGNGSQLFRELELRRQVLAELLHNVRAATTQLTGLVRDNKTSLQPALTELQKTAKLMTHYRGTLDFALKNLAVYVRSLGESVAGGPFFQAYVANLASPEDLITGGIAGIVEQQAGGVK
jgi:phospholipid/cholesterol/gamma-HCH transport system substrate-binding protein